MQKPQGGLGRGLGALLPATPPQAPKKGEEKHEATPSLTFVEEKKSAESLVPSGEAVLRVRPEDIVANPRQPRHYFAPEDLSDLIASVKEHGILQPLVVTAVKDGKYELIAGERRLRSAMAAGLSFVPVLVRKANDQQKLELALIENIQRADLNAVEEARAYRDLMDDFALTQEDVAGRVGKSRSQIANTVRLLELPTEMLAAVADGRISRSHARTLLSEPDADKRRALFQSMLSGGVTVRKAEVATRKRHVGQKDPNIAALEDVLREKLGTKVTIESHGNDRVVAIHCYSKEDLADMVRRLQSLS